MTVAPRALASTAANTRTEVGRSRAARIRRRGELGAADCGTRQRTDHRNRAFEQTAPGYARDENAAFAAG